MNVFINYKVLLALGAQSVRPRLPHPKASPATSGRMNLPGGIWLLRDLDTVSKGSPSSVSWSPSYSGRLSVSLFYFAFSLECDHEKKESPCLALADTSHVTARSVF